MKTGFLFLLLFLSLYSNSQIRVQSPNYTYSVFIPSNWYLTESKTSDINLTDGTGRSYTVTVNHNPSDKKVSVVDEFKNISNAEILQQLKLNFSKYNDVRIKINERKPYVLNQLNFYKLHYSVESDKDPTIHFISYMYYWEKYIVLLNFTCRDEQLSVSKTDMKVLFDSTIFSNPLRWSTSLDISLKFNEILQKHTAKKLISNRDKYKELETKTDRNKENDSWNDHHYRNKVYKFRVSFPKEWEYETGAAQQTLARALNRERGILFLVGVKILPKVQGGTYPEDDMYKNFLDEEFKALNIQVLGDIGIKNSYLFNFPAKMISIKTLQKSGDREFIYLSKQMHCLRNNLLYVLTINLPEDEFTPEIEREWNRFYDSFVFE